MVQCTDWAWSDLCREVHVYSQEQYIQQTRTIFPDWDNSAGNDRGLLYMNLMSDQLRNDYCQNVKAEARLSLLCVHTNSIMTWAFPLFIALPILAHSLHSSGQAAFLEVFALSFAQKNILLAQAMDACLPISEWRKTCSSLLCAMFSSISSVMWYTSSAISHNLSRSRQYLHP